MSDDIIEQVISILEEMEYDEDSNFKVSQEYVNKMPLNTLVIRYSNSEITIKSPQSYLVKHYVNIEFTAKNTSSALKMIESIISNVDTKLKGTNRSFYFLDAANYSTGNQYFITLPFAYELYVYHTNV
jgi:hypothetical protein